jgi:protein SCO1/2
MTAIVHASRVPVLSRLAGFFSGGSFPAFALCLLAFFDVFIAITVLAPAARGSIWGDFLEEFRIRCFNYDPANGRLEWRAVWTMLLEPLPLAAILFFVWRAPLQELWRRRRRVVLPLAGIAAAAVGLIAASLVGFGARPTEQTELPFPAESLRTALPVPAFRLTNQDGQAVALDDFKGKVVLLTAVYSTCTKTCPMMLLKIREVLEQLTPAERADLAVIAFSLKPETDTRELRSITTSIYGFKAPQFHFVSGVPAEVNALLDQLNVAREREAQTGEVIHSNLFFVLDREGRIAYRLSLSQREQSWLVSALRVVLAETAGPALTQRSAQ